MKLRDSRKTTGRLKHLYLRKKENKWRGRDQDGQLGGHGAHILSRKYQKYIYIWNNSHLNLEGLLYSQHCRKDTEVLVRKGRKDIQSGTVHLGGDTKGDHRVS